MKKIIVRNADLISCWETDFGDYQARVRLAENNKEIGEVVVSYEERKILDVIKRKDEQNVKMKEIEMAICVIVLNEDFENLKMLPKISGCSSILQELYDNVCES